MTKPRKRIAGSTGFLLFVASMLLLIIIIVMLVISILTLFVWPCVVSVARMLCGQQPISYHARGCPIDACQTYARR